MARGGTVTRTMRRPLLACALVAVCLAIVLACGSSRSGFDDGSSSGADATFGGGDSQGNVPGCEGLQCSSDLHSIVDCSGREVEKCPADKGCGNGACVAPCEAAAANKSSVGCDYYVYPPSLFSSVTSCLGAFVSNNWGSPVRLTVERGGTPLDASKFSFLLKGSGAAITYAPLTDSVVPPGEIALVMLNRESLDCPNNLPFAAKNAATETTGRGQAFHLTTDAPVVAYDIFPYGGGSTAVSSATLLIPTTAWGDNYIGTTAYPNNASAEDDRHKTFPWLGLVAAEDGTEVTILPSQDIEGGGDIGAAKRGVPVTYSLSRGQYVQLAQKADLTGSIIKANKPIGQWAGHRCTVIPADIGACDGMHQQMPPVRALGHRYVAARYRNRHEAVEETPPWRVVGAVDGTVLTYDPPQPDAPGVLNAGQPAMFNASGPFVVSSQDPEHPFSFSSYMTGWGSVQRPGAAFESAGDPEFVNVISPDQYLASYIFFTDPTYPETNLVFVRRAARDGTFKDVTLDCVGVIKDWKPAGKGYEYTRVDLVRGNFEKQGACDNGRHEAKSEEPFGLTVWGWGSSLTMPAFSSSAVSYAYPAGAGVKAINTVVLPAAPR